MQNQPPLSGSAGNTNMEGDLPQGSVVLPPQPVHQGFGPGMPGTVPVVPNATLHSAPVPELPKKSHVRLIEILIIVFLGIVAVTFIALFIWKFLEWDTLKTDVDSQIEEAVAVAVANNSTELEAEFAQREKYPYKTFAGPADYGSLSFEYPKTWSLYVSKDARSGGNYEAYLNPGEVSPIGNDTIYALRVSILDQAFDNVVKGYESNVKSGKLSIVTRNVGSAVANVYTGELATNIQGIITIFKLRDKTVMLRTDAPIFTEEYYKILDTVTFVE